MKISNLKVIFIHSAATAGFIDSSESAAMVSPFKFKYSSLKYCDIGR